MHSGENMHDELRVGQFRSKLSNGLIETNVNTCGESTTISAHSLIPTSILPGGKPGKGGGCIGGGGGPETVLNVAIFDTLPYRKIVVLFSSYLSYAHI